MLEAIVIQNYKSIQKLALKLGRVNVFIGENGCGKSNILEAVAFAAAAESDKLDNEFLTNRGVRVTRPDLMRASFEGQDQLNAITLKLSFSSMSEDKVYKLTNNNSTYSKWIYDFSNMTGYFDEHFEKYSDFFPRKEDERKRFNKLINANINIKKFMKSANIQGKYLEKFQESLNNFIIFSPENTALRNFYKEGQIEPLGINGEGLFKLLKVINKESPDDFSVIKETLKLFSWYDALLIPDKLCESDDRIKIKDKYLSREFDQRSANEGFLFVLFYTALMVSNDTPAFFAVDNIDASLNPKLCTKIIKVLASLAKKYNKQMLLTTHNPAILDGIDLGDSEQKLYVISRNKKGHTRAKEITVENKPVSSNSEPLKLSEAMLRGYLGGLPKHF